jgi:hypothetical protein
MDANDLAARFGDGESRSYSEHQHSNKMDLRKVAEAVAGRLAGERKQLTIKELKELKMAAHYGGSEFLNMIIDGCMTVVARTQPDLPNPIDPTV